jgi:arylsulfatase A-like enzyme
MKRCAATALLLLALAGCARPPALPELVLITLDTFRQDHLGCTANPDVRTPCIDRLARRGTVFRDAVTPIPLTTPSHASILSGLSPRTHGLLRNRMRLRDGVTTIAQRLSSAGFRTGAVVSSRLVLHPDLRLGRGFDAYDVIEPHRLPASGEGDDDAEHAVAWLAEKGGAGSFLWVHFFDAHLPYLPPAPWDRIYGASADVASPRSGSHADSLDERAVATLRARYAGEISFLDRCVGRIAEAMAARKDQARSVLVITADHGEGLGEHQGYFGHDLQLYESSLRVPLVFVQLRGAKTRTPAPATVSSEAAATLDVAPTLAGLAGLASDPAAEGRDLFRDPAPAGDARRFLAETHPEPDKGEPLYAIRTGASKLIWSPNDRRWECFDLQHDPAELRAGAAPTDSTFAPLAEALEVDLRHRPPGDLRTIDDEHGGPDESTRRALESLGYVGAR